MSLSDMTPSTDFERTLSAWLTADAQPHAPEALLPRTLGRTARTRPRPAWRIPERWLPLTVITRPGLAPPLRTAWILLLVGLLAAALIVGTIVAGSRLLDPPGPDRGTNAHVAAPAVELASTWDASTIEGLSDPLGMDVGPDGNLYVINGGSAEVLVVSPDGAVVRRWGSKGTGDGQFLFQHDGSDPLSSIGGVAVTDDGSVFVADSINDRVQRFGPDGTFQASWGGYGTDDGRFLNPIDIATDGQRLYVADDQRDDVQVFDAGGAYLATIGGHGTDPGQIADAASIGVDAAGDLLAGDLGAERLLRFDRGSGLVGTIDTPAAFRGLQDVDGDTDRVYATDETGLLTIGDATAPPQSWTPPGWAFGFVTVADDGTVYVSSPATDEVHRLRPSSVDVAIAAASPGASPAPPSTAPAAATVPSAATAATPPPPSTESIAHTFGIPLTLTLPQKRDITKMNQPGWEVYRLEPGRVQLAFRRGQDGATAWLQLYLPASTIADPCHPGQLPGSVAKPPTIDELVAGLTSQVGYRAGPVRDVTIDGHPGKAFDLESNLDITTCDDDPWVRQWVFFTGADTTAVLPQDGLTGTHQGITLLDVDGTPVLIEAWDLGATPEELRQMQQIVETMRFG